MWKDLGHLEAGSDDPVTIAPLDSFINQGCMEVVGSPPVRSSALAFLLIAIVVGAIFAAHILSTATESAVHTPECDRQLAAEVESDLCLQLIQISVSSSNSSELSIPVMVMRPGTTTAIDVLYLLSAGSSGNPGPKRNVTTSELPLALSIPSGKVDASKVAFYNASVIFQTKAAIIYRYTVMSAPDSSGYYAILPPYYYGIYPALAVGVDPNNLDKSALSIWGFSGLIESGEFIVPSYIVGTGDLNVVNATVPLIYSCPNPACVMISHSQP